jgi:hypothetical protein
MDYTKNGTSVFDGHNYSFWSKRMRTFFQAQGFDVWKVIVNRYKTPSSPPTDVVGKRLYENNSKA